MLKNLKSYIKGVVILWVRLYPHVILALRKPNLQGKTHRLREVLHSIDKARSLSTFNISRIQDRSKVALQLIRDCLPLEPYNQLLAADLGLIKSNSPSAEERSNQGGSRGLATTRIFLDEPVKADAIEKAVESAIYFPRSCSRETLRLYWLQTLRKDALTLFPGATCFEGESISLAVVVFDKRGYDPFSEVFAGYIDGAIFSTGFCLKLQEMGLGSCMLNWTGYNKKMNDKLRSVLKLAKYEFVVCGIAIGRPKLDATHAPRRVVSDVLRVI